MTEQNYKQDDNKMKKIGNALSSLNSLKLNPCCLLSTSPVSITEYNFLAAYFYVYTEQTILQNR